MGTTFTAVYDRFLNKITDDMYLEWTKYDTLKDIRNILFDAIPAFEFPRQSLEYTIGEIEVTETTAVDTSSFNSTLTDEELNILAILMMQAWVQRQVTTIENIRMKYSGSDFKMTSQANHLAKLLTLQEELRHQNNHMQRLYKRRKTEDGQIKSNWSVFKSRWGE